MNKFVLIDGSSYLYRAYHALPKTLSNAAGEPTGALFGVLNMLRATLKETPDYMVFVLDASGPTFRNVLYDQYKAHRPKMPDDLRSQIEPLCAVVQALGVPLLKVQGVEADDVIGTLALQGAAAGMDVVISTGDKDLAQLVRPGVNIVDTMTGGKLDSTQAVIDKFGVPPEQIIDLLALMGDSADNIPGVDKCGPKTAVKWLSEYGSLDGVIANAAAIKGKIGESLRAALDELPLYRELTTIKTDVELPVVLDELVLRDAEVGALRDFYQHYGFNQMLKELDGGQVSSVTSAPAKAVRPQPVAGAVHRPSDNVADAKWAKPGEYEAILTLEQLNVWLDKLNKAELFAIDTETDALDAMQANLVGLSFAVEVGKAAYLPLGHDYPGAPVQLDQATVLAALKPILEDASKHKVGQHGKYDMHVLGRHGIALQGYREDTLLQAYVLDSTTRLDMDSLAKRYLNYETTPFTEIAGKGAKQIAFSQVALDDATGYAAEDADITLRLYEVLSGYLAAEPALEKVYKEIEMPLVPVLESIEANGVAIDTVELRRQSADLSKRMLVAQQRVTELAGRSFNLDSPKQLQVVLFDELKLPALVKTPKGQPSTNEEALEAIADEHEMPRIILEYRSLTKLRSTYTDKLPEMVNSQTGRVHTSFHQAGAATGRMSSSDPNLQNIPIRTEDGRRIRRAFVAQAGRMLVACDYSQIELRIMAHLSQDKGLLHAFESGIDVHSATAAEVFGLPLEQVGSDQRRAAKAINFGLMYGMSAFGLARNLNIGRAQAQEYINLYFSRYPGVHSFMEQMRQLAHEQGYVETLFGRRLYLNEIHASNQNRRAGAERVAINAPLQGTAADIIKRAMVAVNEWLVPYQDKALMILQVHDELVFEVDADFVDILLPEVTARMSAAAQLQVPLVVDSGVGDNWDQAH